MNINKQEKIKCLKILPVQTSNLNISITYWSTTMESHHTFTHCSTAHSKSKKLNTSDLQSVSGIQPNNLEILSYLLQPHSLLNRPNSFISSMTLILLNSKKYLSRYSTTGIATNLGSNPNGIKNIYNIN